MDNFSLEQNPHCGGSVWASRRMRGLFAMTAAVFVSSTAAQAAVIWTTYDPFGDSYPSGVLPSGAAPAWTAGNGATNFSLNAEDGTLGYSYTQNSVNPGFYELGSPGWQSVTGGAATGNTVEIRLLAQTLGGSATQTLSFTFNDGARRYRLEFAPGKLGINQTGLGVVWYDLPDSTEFHTYTITFTPASQGITIYLDGAATPFASGMRSANDASNNKLILGAITGSSTGGSAQIDYIRWTNDGMFAPIPEPSTMVLVGGVGVALALRRRYVVR